MVDSNHSLVCCKRKQGLGFYSTFYITISIFGEFWPLLHLLAYQFSDLSNGAKKHHLPSQDFAGIQWHNVWESALHSLKCKGIIILTPAATQATPCFHLPLPIQICSASASPFQCHLLTINQIRWSRAKKQFLDSPTLHNTRAHVVVTDNSRMDHQGNLANWVIWNSFCFSCSFDKCGNWCRGRSHGCHPAREWC